MKPIQKRYITDENNERIAVQVDLGTFEQIEQLLEDYALGQFLNEDDSEKLSLNEAKEYYRHLKKVD